MTDTLDWGRHFLMCPPTHFGVTYEINPWMSSGVTVEPDRAYQQWDSLTRVMRDAGAVLEVMEPHESWPDLVFTANAGVVNGRQFVPAHFKWPQRRGETPINTSWFISQGFDVEQLPEAVIHEGAGDALPFGDSTRRVLISAYRTRTDAASHAHLSRITGAPILSLGLTSEWLYHLDLTFTPITNRRALFVPSAFDRTSLRSITHFLPEGFAVEDDEARTFCCNSVVIGTTIVMPSCPPRIGRQLEAWGLDVVVCDVSEFTKAGGGCRCLTLALDVTLSPS